MSLLENTVTAIRKIEGLNGVADALQKVIDADSAIDVTAAASQL